MRCMKVLSPLIFILFYNDLVAQNSPKNILDSLSGRFITDTRENGHERALLITDKSVFVPGESIWLRALLLNSLSGKVSAKSRFLFVDLVDEKDSVIKFMILDALNKQLSSRMVLPRSITGGNYWLRAYTRTMTEGDSMYMSVKPIYITSGNDKPHVVDVKKNPQSDTLPAISFFPEGGSMITGANSLVAVRASYRGNPVVVEGFIKDGMDGVASHFKTNSAGLGEFDFEPSGYRKYRAVVDWNGKDISYPLPPFNFYGGQVSVTRETSSYKLRILLEDSLVKRSSLTYLMGVSRDSLFFASIGRGLYEISIDKQKIPDGIATFYLFDKDLNLLSERSIYVRENNLRITASSDKQSYPKRARVTLNLSVTDANQNPIPSLLAISVTDSVFSWDGEECPPPTLPQDQNDIDEFFLANNDCLTDKQIDQLMLLKNNTFRSTTSPSSAFKIQDIDSILHIKGTVLNGRNEPVGNQTLTLISNSGGAMVQVDTTDVSGRFLFPLEYYKDSAQFSLQAANTSGSIKNYDVILDAFNYPKMKTPIALKQRITGSEKDVIKRVGIYFPDERNKQVLTPVTVNYREKGANYDVSKRVSSTSSILTSNELNERTSVGNAILRVSGVHVLNGVLIINGLTSMKAPDVSSEPLLLVDGVQIAASAASQIGESSPDLSYLNSLNPKDIDFIEILKGPEGANYGVRGGNGVILVNMLSSRRELKTNDNNLKIFYPNGISTPVLFPIVDYSDDEARSKPETDNRSVLFWNGSFLSDASGKAAITFYTSDIPSTYKINITGITTHGDFIHKTISIKTR